MTVKFTKEQIQEWLVNKIATELAMEEQDVDINTPFKEFGIDSITLVKLTSQIEDWLHIELDPVLMYKFETIHEISDFILKDQLKA